jgi:hypothetical protein
MDFPFRLIPAAAAVCLLASCGGGGAGDPPPLPPPVATGGVAVDGYLVGSTVLCDANGNGVADPGELSAGTDADGAFEFRTGCDAGVVVRGGASKDTGLPFTGVLTAPAGATVASPLTTLLGSGVAAGRLLDALGLDAGIDLLNTDPAEGMVGERPNIDLLKATLAVQQLLQKTAELLAGLGGVSGTATLQAVYVEVAAAFASELGGGGALVAAGAIDPAVVSRLVAAAATRVRNASTVGSAIPAALASINADALATMTSGAMAVQASALLAATDAGLTEATAQQQSDVRITGFAIDNRAALAGPPDATTAALGAELTDIVAGVEPPTDFLALTGDAIELVSGSDRQALTIAQFQSAEGASVSWPIAADATLSVGLTEVGSYAVPTDMKLTAAISITDDAAGGQGELQAYIDDVRVEKTAGGLRVSVPATANARVYGVSADGRKKAVIDFANSVAGVTNTLRTAAGSSNSIVFGEVVDFAIERLAQDFTGLQTLRGSYSVSVVISGLPLRRADGTALPAVTVTVPTAIDAQGAVTASKSVAGPGLVGTIRLTD